MKRKESQRGGCWRGQNLKQLEFFGIGQQRSLHRNQTRCKTVLAQKLWGTHGTMKSRADTMKQQSGNRAAHSRCKAHCISIVRRSKRAGLASMIALH